jgi:predicted signal transduction protein with EAL and GGDEF domain
MGEAGQGLRTMPKLEVDALVGGDASVGRTLPKLIGAPITSLIADGDSAALRAVSAPTGGTIEVDLIASGERRVPVRINTSTLDLVEDQIHRHHIDPGQIVVEITETALMRNIDHGRQFAERMVALGCSFALDDFGTGFASFTYLKRFPVQYLKIDIEFVRDVVSSEQDRSVVSAIVGLARGFGLESVAEGVEDEETAGVLKSLGVAFAQGYWFGAPGPPQTQPPSAPEGP